MSNARCWSSSTRRGMLLPLRALKSLAKILMVSVATAFACFTPAVRVGTSNVSFAVLCQPDVRSVLQTCEHHWTIRSALRHYTAWTPVCLLADGIVLLLWGGLVFLCMLHVCGVSDALSSSMPLLCARHVFCHVRMLCASTV